MKHRRKKTGKAYFETKKADSRRLFRGIASCLLGQAHNKTSQFLSFGFAEFRLWRHRHGTPSTATALGYLGAQFGYCVSITLVLVGDVLPCWTNYFFVDCMTSVAATPPSKCRYICPHCAARVHQTWISDAYDNRF